jgi:hypothetical protein
LLMYSDSDHGAGRRQTALRYNPTHRDHDH